jgi:hypothetical protein
MHMKGLGLGGLFAVVALVGCGSSGGSGGTTGTGGSGTTGKAGSTGTGGSSNAGHTGSTGSGGTTGGGGAFTTSVPSNTKLTGLTNSQLTQFCADGDNFIEHTYIPTLCDIFTPTSGIEAATQYLQDNPAATNAQLQTACAQSEADAGTCLFTEDPDGGLGTCNIGSIPASCQATVGDETKCLNDTVTALAQYTDSVPKCSSLTAAIVNAFAAADGGGTLGPAEPASCAVFETGGACSSDDAGTNASPKMPLRATAMARAFMR